EVRRPAALVDGGDRQHVVGEDRRRDVGTRAVGRGVLLAVLAHVACGADDDRVPLLGRVLHRGLELLVLLVDLVRAGGGLAVVDRHVDHAALAHVGGLDDGRGERGEGARAFLALRLPLRRVGGRGTAGAASVPAVAAVTAVAALATGVPTAGAAAVAAGPAALASALITGTRGGGLLFLDLLVGLAGLADGLDLDVGSDAREADVAGGLRADDAGDLGAVPVAVEHAGAVVGLLVHQVEHAFDPAVEVGMPVPDTGVDDRDGLACTGLHALCLHHPVHLVQAQVLLTPRGVAQLLDLVELRGRHALGALLVVLGRRVAAQRGGARQPGVHRRRPVGRLGRRGQGGQPGHRGADGGREQQRRRAPRPAA